MKPQFNSGDEVVKGRETGRIQMRQNRSTKEYFPVVVILTGKRRGQSEYVKGWKLVEDRADETRPDREAEGLTQSELHDMLNRPWRFRETR